MPTTITIRERQTPQSLTRRVLEGIRSYTIGQIALKDLHGAKLKEFFGEGYQTAAGLQVTAENSFTFSAVYDAVNQSSSDLAKLPLNLRKRKQGGGTEPFDTSKTYWLLKSEANPDMSAFEFRRTMQAHALTLKGAFAEIERDAAGRPVALWPMTPDRVEPKLETITLPNGRYRSVLRYQIDGDSRHVMDAKDVLHIHGLGYDGYCAYPVIDRARQAIGIALAAERFAGAFFGNDSNLGGVLSAIDADLDEDQAQVIQDRIEKIHKGPERAWKMLVLGSGFKYYRTGVTPQESQMDALRDAQVVEVARFFNFPVHKLKNLDRATNNNIEQQALEYYTGHQLNWMTVWEQELNRKLVPALEIGQQFFKHSAIAVLRGDTAARTAFYTAMLDRGVFCADDVLEWEDLNPQPNGQGKIFFIQGAMVPKDKVNAIADANIEKAKNKAPAQAPPPAPAPAGPTRQELEAAIGRANRSDEAAAAAQALAAREREIRLVAEATGTATVAELTALRESERRAQEVSAQTLVLAASLRADAEAQVQRADAADAARLEAEEDVRAAEAAAAAAEARVAEAETRVGAAEAATRAADAAASDARLHLEAASVRAADAIAAAAAAGEDQDQAAAVVRVVKGDLEAARTQLASLEGERAEASLATTRASEDASAARAALSAATVDLERLRAEHAAAISAATAHADELQGQLTAAQDRIRDLQQDRTAALEQLDAQRALVATRQGDVATLNEAVAATRAELSGASALLAGRDAAISAFQLAVGALERERDIAQANVGAAQAAAEATATRIAFLEEAIRVIRQSDAGAAAETIAAHRVLIVETMRRMVERETDRARGKGQQPEKLRQWLEEFYLGHEEYMRTALLPAIRIHLAFIRSIEDPIEATRRIVQDHIAQSQRQLRTIVDGEAPDLAPSLHALLHRWDQERPAVLADRLMAKELDYARGV